MNDNPEDRPQSELEEPAEPPREADAERAEPVEPPREADAERAEPVEPPLPEEVAEAGREFVSGLLEAMGLSGEVTARVEGETAHLEVVGETLGGLIGRRGQTLEALQELARTAVQRRLQSRVRLLIDVEGYRARRRESLREYARSMAQRAIERGSEIELEVMNAYERKIVHDAVGEIEGATSFSEGEEPNRRVIVSGA